MQDGPVEDLPRVSELSLLNQRLGSGRPEFLVVYGRRRVGNTELLAHLAAQTRSFYFEATDTVPAQQLRDLTAELSRVSGDELLRVQALTSWDAALTAIAQFVGTQRTLVVIDEFQLLAATYLDGTVMPALDHHASLTWEEICRQHVLREAAGATAAGRWWGQVRLGSGPHSEEREVDVVAVDGAGTPVAIGMCKWTSKDVDFDELNLLDRLAPAMEGYSGQDHRYLFSRNGFSPRLVTHAESDPTLHLVTPADIYA